MIVVHGCELGNAKTEGRQGEAVRGCEIEGVSPKGSCKGKLYTHTHVLC